MDRYREKTSAFFTRLTYGLSRGYRPMVVVDRSPVPQTSLSMSSRISSLDRVLIYSIPLSQFSNSQTSSSFPSFLTSTQTRDRPGTIHSSAFRMDWGLIITVGHGCGFYDRYA